MNDSIADPLADWRQGDFVCGSHGFVCLGSDGKTVGAKTIGIDALGYVLISQSCDIVRRTSGRDFVAVCPLIRIDEEKSKAAKKGRLPYMISVESAGAFVYADLRRVMSVEKDVLATWQRNVGFSTEKDRLKFAAALERKFGQFAFPDEFDAATKSFKEKVWSRYDKNSPFNPIYKSLKQIRFGADPDWETSDSKRIFCVAVLSDQLENGVTREDVSKSLNNEFDAIEWPEGYEWNDPRLLLQTARDLTGEDLISTQRADFDFLSY